MTIAINFPTSATLGGGMDLSRMHRHAAENDLGAKIQFLLSAMNAANTAISAIQIALGSAAASMAGASQFSAFSAFAGVVNAGTVSVMGPISNLNP